MELIDSTAGVVDPDVARARMRATAVVANHHNLLLALPGTGAARTAADRATLARLERADHSNTHNHNHRNH